MNNLGVILGEVYEPRYRDLFKYHPNCNEIVSKLVKGELSSNEIDRVFQEAEFYVAEHLKKKFKLSKGLVADNSTSFTRLRDGF